MSELTAQTCITCGVVFGISSNWSETLKKSHNFFYCPNGHSLHYPAPPKQESEVETLRTDLKELQGKLTAALDDATKQTKKVEELTLELEIWRPSEKSA